MLKHLHAVDASPPEEERGKIVARFHAFINSYNGTKYDEVALVVVVPKQWKYKALPITDQGGYMYEFEVRTIKRLTDPDPFEGEDDG